MHKVAIVGLSELAIKAQNNPFKFAVTVRHP